MTTPFSPAEQHLIALWERHVRLEFVDRDSLPSNDLIRRGARR